MPVSDIAVRKSLWKLKGYIKVGPVAGHKKNLLSLEGDRNQQVDILVCSLEVATWVIK